MVEHLAHETSGDLHVAYMKNVCMHAGKIQPWLMHKKISSGGQEVNAPLGTGVYLTREEY